jgi:hypothetical protein
MKVCISQFRKDYGVKLTLRQKRGEMAKTLNEKIEHAEVMPFPIELSHSTSRSASEQQEPTDITIVSTNIDEPEPSTAASSVDTLLLVMVPKLITV